MSYKVFWLGADEQYGFVAGGRFLSLKAAKESIPAFHAEMLAQSLDDDPDCEGLMTKSAVRAGTYVIEFAPEGAEVMEDYPLIFSRPASDFAPEAVAT